VKDPAMRILAFLFFLFQILTINAQEQSDSIKRCGTMDHLELRLNDNPELKDNMHVIEIFTQKWIKRNANSFSSGKEVIVIPVVVHVVYNNAEQNISDAQIMSQLEVLNQDYRRNNADAANTPSFFVPFAADCQIEFCLAKRTPEDSASSGIIRKYTSVESFTLDNKVKFDTAGGSDAWDRDKYLNLWVCNMGGGYLGYASWPGDKPEVDGVVIRYQSFGKHGSAQPPYHLGRTCTHEVGHWLNLLHPWGNWGGCNDDDYVSDTPLQEEPHYYCPSYPKPSCSDTSDMFMTYMDYVDDSCMNIFTQGQKARMMAVMDSVRAPLKTSNGCQPAGIAERNVINDIQVFPNPSSGMVNILSSGIIGADVIIRAYNSLGKEIASYQKEKDKRLNDIIDLSDNPSGVYFLRIVSAGEYRSVKVFLIKE
jgi:hypothetical protein